MNVTLCARAPRSSFIMRATSARHGRKQHRLCATVFPVLFIMRGMLGAVEMTADWRCRNDRCRNDLWVQNLARAGLGPGLSHLDQQMVIFYCKY